MSWNQGGQQGWGQPTNQGGWNQGGYNQGNQGNWGQPQNQGNWNQPANFGSGGSGGRIIVRPMNASLSVDLDTFSKMVLI